MPVCKNCKSQFSNWYRLDGGRLKNLSKRKFCLNCSPFGSHNTKPCIKPTTEKFCNKCNFSLPLDSFYIRPRREKRILTAYCKKCTNKLTTIKHQLLKEQYVAYKGGKCQICGYNKCLGALEFHHRDPNEKEFNLSVFRRDFESVKSELDKCDLLCANCHREQEELLKCPCSSVE